MRQIGDPFVISSSRQAQSSRSFLHPAKRLHDKPTADSAFNAKKLNAFPLGSRIREGMPLPLLFSILLVVPVSAISQEKEIKG